MSSASCPTLQNAIVVLAAIRGVAVPDLVAAIKEKAMRNEAELGMLTDYFAELDEIAKLHIQ